MPTYSEIEDKAEDAIDALLASNLPSALSGLDRLKGLGAQEIKDGHVFIIAEEAEEAHPSTDSGNWIVLLKIGVKTNINANGKTGARAVHKQRSAALMDFLLYRENFLDELNAAYASEPFHAMAWSDFKKARRVEGKFLVSELAGHLLCMGNDP